MKHLRVYQYIGNTLQSLLLHFLEVHPALLLHETFSPRSLSKSQQQLIAWAQAQLRMLCVCDNPRMMYKIIHTICNRICNILTSIKQAFIQSELPRNLCNDILEESAVLCTIIGQHYLYQILDATHEAKVLQYGFQLVMNALLCM